MFCRTLGRLGGRLPCFRTGPPPCFRTGQAHSTVFNSRYPRRLDYRVSCATGHVYCPCSGSASRQRHLVLLDLGSRKSQISCRIATISVCTTWQSSNHPFPETKTLFGGQYSNMIPRSNATPRSTEAPLPHRGAIAMTAWSGGWSACFRSCSHSRPAVDCTCM